MWKKFLVALGTIVAVTAFVLLEPNDELNVATQERSLAARMTEQFNQDLRKAKRLDLERWRQRPRLEKLREWIWASFGEVF